MQNKFNKNQEEKIHNLEERTYAFADQMRLFTRRLPRSEENLQDIKQLTSLSGFVASNYIEADETLNNKDFLTKVRTCRKELRECRLYLRIVDTGEIDDLKEERERLINETKELMMIFDTIISKT